MASLIPVESLPSQSQMSDVDKTWSAQTFWSPADGLPGSAFRSM